MDNKNALIKKINQVIDDLIISDTTIITEFPQSFPEAEVLSTMKIMHEASRKKMLDLVEKINSTNIDKSIIDSHWVLKNGWNVIVIDVTDTKVSTKVIGSKKTKTYSHEEFLKKHKQK